MIWGELLIFLELWHKIFMIKGSQTEPQPKVPTSSNIPQISLKYFWTPCDVNSSIQVL